MIHLLVNEPGGNQRLLKIDVSGGYFDLSRVLWDERKDGNFPSELLNKVGGLERAGGELQFNQLKFDAQLERQKPTISSLRKAEYQKHDELRNEAIVEKLQGRDEKWLEYLAIREAIKAKYPKPL